MLRHGECKFFVPKRFDVETGEIGVELARQRPLYNGFPLMYYTCGGSRIYIGCLRQVVAFASKVIIACLLQQGFCIRKTRQLMRRLRRRTRGEHRFMKLMK